MTPRLIVRHVLLALTAFTLVTGPAWAQGNPVGPEFRVNTYTTNAQTSPAVASFASGGFVVAWQSDGQDGSLLGVFAQRYDAAGAPLGSEFRVNTYTIGHQAYPSVATDPASNFVVVWWSTGQDGSNNGVFAQRYSTSGAPLGSEFRVNTATIGHQYFSAVAADPGGNFAVVWASYDWSGSEMGIFGQRYASSGAPLGSEFRVNTYTTFQQGRPAVAADGAGNFVVVWESNVQDGSFFGVFGQRYASTGAPARSRVPGQPVHHQRSARGGRRGRSCRQLRRHVGKRGESLRSALRQLRGAPGPGVPGQLLQPRLPRGAVRGRRSLGQLRDCLVPH